MATFKGTPSHTRHIISIYPEFYVLCRREGLFKSILLLSIWLPWNKRNLPSISWDLVLVSSISNKHAPGCSIFGHSWTQKPSKSLSSTPPRCQVQDRNPLNLACWQKPHQIKNPAAATGGFTSCFWFCACVFHKHHLFSPFCKQIPEQISR